MTSQSTDDPRFDPRPTQPCPPWCIHRDGPSPPFDGETDVPGLWEREHIAFTFDLKHAQVDRDGRPYLSSGYVGVSEMVRVDHGAPLQVTYQRPTLWLSLEGQPSFFTPTAYDAQMLANAMHDYAAAAQMVWAWWSRRAA